MVHYLKRKVADFRETTYLVEPDLPVNETPWLVGITTIWDSPSMPTVDLPQSPCVALQPAKNDSI